MVKDVEMMGDVEKVVDSTNELIDRQEYLRALNDMVEGYYRFKKFAIIASIVEFDRASLENPDIIAILLAETLYNTYTGKLIISRGSIPQFMDHVGSIIKSGAVGSLSPKLAILKDALDNAFLNDSSVEFVDLSKMSIEDYLKKWEAESGSENIN